MENTKPINWNAARAALQKEHPHLTDDDLLYEEGKDEETLERLARKLNQNKEELRKGLTLMG